MQDHEPDPVDCSAHGDSMPFLQFQHDGNPLFVHTLRPGRTVLGRSDRCDLALPSEGVSRVHCVIERRTEGWRLTDRSKHGTRVNGETVSRAIIGAGDVIELGPYRAIFKDTGNDSSRAVTSTTPVLGNLHEELVEVDEEAGTFTAARGVMRFTQGPLVGETRRLDRSRMSVGGPRSTIVLDADLPRAACWIRVVRGRVMIEPGHLPVTLAGSRVRDVTPALAGEQVRVGGHAFSIETETVSEQARSSSSFGEMVGEAEGMQRLFGILQRIAAHDAPVLVIGESGTGKELAARGLHDCGPRMDAPFIAVNCAAIAHNLFESELFGHEKGAFTGATARQDGAFHHADGGTLFLDEIGELKLDLQAKLLRALESGEVKRVGGAKPEFPDVRLVAATNRNLNEMVKQGAFREDLFFRLSVLFVRTPPIRERGSDLGLLAKTLMQRHHPGARLTDDAIEALQGYPWPGNVRELRNVLTRAVVLGGPVVHAADLQFNPWAFDGDRRDSGPTAHRPDERLTIESALKKTKGNRTQAARLLGMPRSSLLYKLGKLGLM